MTLLWPFAAGWAQCVASIMVDLGGTPWHAVAVTTRKHLDMARFLRRERGWRQYG